MRARAGAGRSGFNTPEVVSLYGDAPGLTHAEQHLFRRHLAPGRAILDVGVGAGRTTPALSAIADRYVGVDIAENMVRHCQARFPGLEFCVADAADLSGFADASFDAVVFSFNGIDCLHPDEQRHRFVGHAARILRPGGRLILSVHNARSIGILPIRQGRGWWHTARTVKWGLTENTRRLWSIPTSRAFWRGEGYVFDPIHGGMVMHMASRRRVTTEMGDHGFEVLEVVGSNHPLRLPSIVTSWWHYAFRRP